MNTGYFKLKIPGAGCGDTSLLAGILDGGSLLDITLEQFAAHLAACDSSAAILLGSSWVTISSRSS